MWRLRTDQESLDSISCTGRDESAQKKTPIGFPVGAVGGLRVGGWSCCERPIPSALYQEAKASSWDESEEVRSSGSATSPACSAERFAEMVLRKVTGLL